MTKRDGRLAWHLSNLITLCGNCYDRADELRNSDEQSRVGVVLCGGKGTRLYPLTAYCNKHTLPIGIIPMVFYPIKTLRSFGIKRVLVVTDRADTGEITQMLGSGKEFGMEITYRIQEGAGGISEALYLAKDFARPGDDIVCILGDNVFDNSALDTEVELSSGEACVFLKEVDNPQSYGVATIENDQVVEIIEKPNSPKSNLAVVGLYAYTYDVFDIISSIEPSGRGELEISSVNDFYAKANKLSYKVVSGYWGDAGGSISRYAECSMQGAKEANVSANEIDNFRAVVFDDK
jgi:glucose-1-phosphate thymidylyltransferase